MERPLSSPACAPTECVLRVGGMMNSHPVWVLPCSVDKLCVPLSLTGLGRDRGVSLLPALWQAKDIKLRFNAEVLLVSPHPSLTLPRVLI